MSLHPNLPCHKNSSEIRDIAPNRDAHIVIIGQERTGELSWTVQVQCGQLQPEYTELNDPSFEMKSIAEEDLRWYLEDYAPKYPYDVTRAAQIETNLMKYGQALVDSFQILSIEMVRLVLPSYEEHNEPIVIDVLDNECPSLLQAIHWEVLENAASWDPRASGPANLTVRRKVISTIPPRLLPANPSSRKKPTFNILLVNSRPNKVKDIDPLLGIRGIIETLSKLDPRLRDTINFEIVRPGTWSTFEDHLVFRTEQWHKDGGTGPWFDIVHFDVHGEIIEGYSHLILLSKGGKNALAVSASAVAQLLRDCEIENVFINSCLSAKALGCDASNLAEILVRKGVRSVIAMSFSFTSGAAKRLITTFYSTYLLDPAKDMAKALKCGRDALQKHTERDATFGLKVNVKDFIVPVLYLDHQWKNEYCVPEVSSEPLDPNSYTMNAALQPSIVRVLAQNDLEVQLQSNHANFGGREQDIMEIEASLLRNTKSNILVLYGMAGVGKSALVQFLNWWWGITELIQNTMYYSLAPGPITENHGIPEELISANGRHFQDTLYLYLQQHRRLFVLDDFDAALHPRFTADREVSYTDAQKEQLRDFILRLRGGRSLVILASRCRHDWLNLGNRAHYRLRGLAHYDSTMVASSSLRDLGLSHMVENRESAAYLGHIVDYVDHNPQAILTFLRVLKEDPQISNPRELLETLQTGFVTLPHSYERQMRILFIRKLKITPGLNSLLLHGLAPLWSTFTSDWFESLSESLKQEKPTEAPSKNDVREFFIANAVDTGWIESDDKSTTGKTLFRIDPILSNLLRNTIAWGESQNPVKNWEAVCTSTTAIYHWFQLENLTAQDIATPSLEHAIQHEIPNYLYALGVCLYLMPYESTFVHAGYKIFFELWSIATTGNTLRLPVPSMVAYGDQFLKNLLKHDSDLKSLDKHEMAYFIQLSTMICEYLVRRQPKHAASYLEPIVKSFPRLEEIAVENDPQMEILYTSTLLSLGQVAMYKDGDMERAEGYFLKTINQASLAENNSNPDWSIKKRWLEMSAYTNLLELYMGEEKRLDQRQTIREAAKDAFKKYTELISTVSSNQIKTLALGYVPAALVEWVMASPRDPQISSFFSLSEQRANASGLLKVALVLGEAARLRENGKIVEARQILLKAVSQAMSAEDKEAEYPCQLNLAIMAAQEGNTATADLHLSRLKILEEELHGGVYLPMSSLSSRQLESE